MYVIYGNCSNNYETEIVNQYKNKKNVPININLSPKVVYRMNKINSVNFMYSLKQLTLLI